MQYTTEERKHVKCVVCKKDLGEQSKRVQWRKVNCFECGQRANVLALELNIDFGQAIQKLTEEVL